MNTVLKKVALATAISCAMSSTAFAGVSANIGVTSDYIWRGVTQNDNNPSYSGGLDYEHDSGFYVGTWAGYMNSVGRNTEIDVYTGFSKELENGFGYDIGINTYQYPGASSDFTEAYLNTSYKFIEVGIASTIDADKGADAFGTNGDLYSHITLSKDIGSFGTSATVGDYNYDSGGALASNDYTHYQVAASYEIPNNFGELTGAIDKAEGNSSKASLSWSKSFDF